MRVLMSRKLILGLMALAGCAASALVAGAAPMASAFAPKGDVASGRELYSDKGCAGCHGPAGKGGAAGAALAGTEMDWGVYLGQLRKPRANMPAYDLGMMSDQEIADTYAYLKSVAAPKAPVATAPLAQMKGDVLAGRKTYLENGCHACHGSVGQGGGPGPILAATPMSLGSYYDQVRKPRALMPAYAASLMTEQEIVDTYAYVRSLPGPRSPGSLPALLRAPPR